MDGSVNSMLLRGVLCGAPMFSHMGGGERYFLFPVEAERLSGHRDRLNVIARESLLRETEIYTGGKLAVSGEIRSYNNRSGAGSRLVITVLARSLEICDGPFENRAVLRGVLCKTPVLRCTPMGRQICDILLAVNRPYGRSDYLPVIAWGGAARYASDLAVGDRIALEGRLQSRDYIKLTDGVPLRRTAFEVSAVSLEREDSP